MKSTETGTETKTICCYLGFGTCSNQMWSHIVYMQVFILLINLQTSPYIAIKIKKDQNSHMWRLCRIRNPKDRIWRAKLLTRIYASCGSTHSLANSGVLVSRFTESMWICSYSMPFTLHFQSISPITPTHKSPLKNYVLPLRKGFRHCWSGA